MTVTALVSELPKCSGHGPADSERDSDCRAPQCAYREEHDGYQSEHGENGKVKKEYDHRKFYHG
jgi:hypothetical protein